MKKISLLLLAATFVLASCDKEDDEVGTSSSYPTDGLTVDEKVRPLMLEHTGAWCQYCPNGAVTMAEMLGKYGSDIIAVANHDKDALTFPVNAALAANFPPAGFPNFSVMNEDVGQAPESKLIAAMSSAPIMGVTHAVVSTDSSWNVYPKIQVFESVLAEDFLVNSYIVLDEVIAKDFGGGVDLNQVSSVAVAGGSNPTKWLQDAAFVNGEALIKSGTDYYHKENLVMGANTPNPFGKAIADVNPFGNEYIEGDILGTQHTSIVLSLPKPDIDALPYETGLSVVTIIWRLRTDGSGSFDYVNGFMSHHVTD